MAKITKKNFIEHLFYQNLPILPVKQNTKEAKVNGWVKMSINELRENFDKDDNVGLRCGEGSVFVIDFDVLKNESNVLGDNDLFHDIIEKLDENDHKYAVQTTRSGGKHLCFKYCDKISHITNKVGIKINGNRTHIDIRTNGGQILVEPSIIDGKKYIWDKGPLLNDLDEIPD